MKLTILLICFVFSGFNVLSGQVFTLPDYDKRSHRHVLILEIKSTADATIVRCKYTVQENYNPLFEQLTIFMKENTFIRDSETGRLFKLRETKNIPIEPGRRLLQYPGQEVEFDLIFPPLPKNIQVIDLIEETAEQGFNFYRIRLEPVA